MEGQEAVESINMKVIHGLCLTGNSKVSRSSHERTWTCCLRNHSQGQMKTPELYIVQSLLGTQPDPCPSSLEPLRWLPPIYGDPSQVIKVPTSHPGTAAPLAMPVTMA